MTEVFNSNFNFPFTILTYLLISDTCNLFINHLISVPLSANASIRDCRNVHKYRLNNSMYQLNNSMYQLNNSLYTSPILVDNPQTEGQLKSN